jgi:hypothetical protein
MTPLEVIGYAGAIGLGLIIIAICAGLAFVIYTTAVKAAQK